MTTTVLIPAAIAAWSLLAFGLGIAVGRWITASSTETTDVPDEGTARRSATPIHQK